MVATSVEIESMFSNKTQFAIDKVTNPRFREKAKTKTNSKNQAAEISRKNRKAI